MNSAMHRAAVVVVLGVALTACGGELADNGGGGNGSVADKAAVLRELGQFGRFLDVGAPLYGEAPSQGGPTFSVGPATTPPSTGCDSGAATAINGTAPSSFEYFDAAETADYKIYRYTNCRNANRSDAGVDYVQDGTLELGSLRGFDPTDLSDISYSYAAYGDDTTDYAYERNVRDAAGTVAEQVIEQIYGRIERAGEDFRTRTGAVISRVITRTVPDGYTLSWQQGTPASPLYTDASLGGGGFKVRGPIDYESSQCSGGVRHIAIAAPGVQVVDGVPVDGTLNLTLGTGSLTLEFDDEGADISFASGEKARLSSAEIEAAMSDPQC